jgi:hypothetical protein
MTDDRDRELEAKVGTRVDYPRLPAWLRNCLGRRLCGGTWTAKVSVPGASFLVSHEGERPYWLDHWGTTHHRGKEVFVCEPYGLGSKHVGMLMEFCQALNLDYEVSACSYHYPTQTLRILIWPREWGNPSEWGKPEGEVNLAADMILASQDVHDAVSESRTELGTIYISIGGQNATRENDTF